MQRKAKGLHSVAFAAVVVAAFALPVAAQPQQPGQQPGTMPMDHGNMQGTDHSRMGGGMGQHMTQPDPGQQAQPRPPGAPAGPDAQKQGQQQRR